MKIADSDLDRIRRERAGGQHTQTKHASQHTDHDSTLTFLIDRNAETAQRQ
jgi:hypothetical protein